jgi:ribosomal protein S27AE
MRVFEEIPRLECVPLQELYELVDTARCDEIMAADRQKNQKPGEKVAMTRLRVKLSRISKLCKQARKEILVMRDGDKDEMEKYGVEEDEEQSKQASVSKTCPSCGGKVEKHGNTFKCVNCGTEPFEPEE